MIPLPKNYLSRRSAQSGTSLIEVLIALLIFCFGILGLVGLQANATKVSYDAEDRTRASLIAADMVAEMQYLKAASPACPAAAKLATLPAATCVPPVGPDANGAWTITIQWRAPSRKASDLDSQYITQVAL